jgi:putative DNA primase/helicase
LIGQQKKGSNPEIANMNNKRFVIAKEPESSEFINVEIMKNMTGADEINARLNHSNDTEISLCLTLIMECNKKPRMSEVNNATAMRIEDIPFESTFYKKEDYDNLDEDEKATAFIGNKEFKSKHFKKAHRQALFEILRTYYKKYLDNGSNLQYSESIKKRNKDYLLASDRLNEFVNENYKLTKNDKDRIKLKTVYEDFKISDYYRNLTKQEMNNLTYKKFQENLQENYFLKKFIKFVEINIIHF